MLFYWQAHLGGAPFYAGSFQQGLRTLVVFCLPSALGLPESDAKANEPSALCDALTNSKRQLSITGRGNSISNMSANSQVSLQSHSHSIGV
jgi:hypothetical protein